MGFMVGIYQTADFANGAFRAEVQGSDVHVFRSLSLVVCNEGSFLVLYMETVVYRYKHDTDASTSIKRYIYLFYFPPFLLFSFQNSSPACCRKTPYMELLSRHSPAYSLAASMFSRATCNPGRGTLCSLAMARA
jgi:hypothetical protein